MNTHMQTELPELNKAFKESLSIKICFQKQFKTGYLFWKSESVYSIIMDKSFQWYYDTFGIDDKELVNKICATSANTVLVNHHQLWIILILWPVYELLTNCLPHLTFDWFYFNFIVCSSSFLGHTFIPTHSIESHSYVNPAMVAISGMSDWEATEFPFSVYCQSLHLYAIITLTHHVWRALTFKQQLCKSWVFCWHFMVLVGG